MNTPLIPEKKINKKTGDYIDTSIVIKAFEPALYYGFVPLKTPHLTDADIKDAKKISEGEIVVDSEDHESGASVRLEEKIALLRMYHDQNMSSLPQPLMFLYKQPFVGDKKKTRETHCGLEIIGASKSVAEAILIQTAMSILTENGAEDLHVDINSIGDKESLARFTRELTAYYRKHLSALPADCKQAFKKDVFSLLGCSHEGCKALALECPKSINFLSEKSRQHFKEVLEFIEALNIPYTINNTLVSNRDYCSETIFEIRSGTKKQSPLAIGLRYDTLSKKVGFKREVPAVGVSLAFKTELKDIVKPAQVQKTMNPKIGFIQLGFEAKLKSLQVTDILRKVKIPISQSLAKDKIAGQVGSGERNDLDYVLIMAKKEAMENSVIVRDAVTRAQDTVPLTELASHIKELYKKEEEK